MSLSSTSMYCIANKLKRIKLDLKFWSKHTFGNFKQKLEKNTDKLLSIEQKLVSQPNNARLNNWHFRLIKQREKMHFFNQKNWGKMARKEWLVNGDRNFRYFHQSMKARKSRSSIVKIKDSSGVWRRMSLKSKSSLFKISIHDYWYIIHKDVYQAIKSFFLEEKLLKQINHTLIALIPKIDNHH